MKRRIFLIGLTLLNLSGLTAGEMTWEWDAGRGDAYLSSGDCDAAWLFYERAMAAGADDGLVVFRAAESYAGQQMFDDPEFGENLYAVAHYLMQNQYPDNPALDQAAAHFDPELRVNRRLLRQTYGAVGGRAPRTRYPVAEGVGSVSAFFSSSLSDLTGLVTVIRTDGLRAGWDWARSRIWNIALAILMVNALTGIILPAVMAVAVAKEGRKSYVTAYLFLIHWGPLGIHRFYLGRYVSGIIWLVTGGLLGLGVFFDIFLTGAYVRFWNEDHRDERPIPGRVVSAPRSGRKRRKNTRSGKSSGQSKPKKAKAPRKSRKPKKAEGIGLDDGESFDFSASGAAVAGAGVASASDFADDGFSFSAPDGPAESGSADRPVSGGPSDDAFSDDDFGDLPDLDLGDGDIGGIPEMPSAAAGGDSAAELPEELSDDEFDIGSLE